MLFKTSLSSILKGNLHRVANWAIQNSPLHIHHTQNGKALQSMFELDICPQLPRVGQSSNGQQKHGTTALEQSSSV